MKEYFQILKQKFSLFILSIKNKFVSLKYKLKQCKAKEKVVAFFASVAAVWHKIYSRFYNFFSVAGQKLASIGIKANWISWIGFFIGIFAVNFLAMEMYGWALFAILLNRLCDALDGAIARATETTPFGVFLDATLDYVFYASVLWGFALGNSDNATAACFLMFGFTSAACAMLAYSVIAFKINSNQTLNLDNSPFYLGGIAQGSETFVVMVVLCLMPSCFVQLAVLLGVLSLIKAFSVIVAAYYHFVIMAKK